MKTVVWIQTQFVGFHRFKDAPDEVAFLRDWHRHVFHVKLGVEVFHDNRQIEFFDLKGRVNQFLNMKYHGTRFEYSCEQIAEVLRQEFNACEVTVSEDGENGATIYH